MVYLIQTRLKINTSDVGSQCISITCTESEFVGVFCGFIDRYSPGGNQYSCIFQEPDAYETLGKILNRSNWDTREYRHKQETQVVLVSEFYGINSEIDSSTNLIESLSQTQTQKAKAKCIKKDTLQLTVNWKRRIIIDNANNKSCSGWITIRFITDQLYYS